MQLSNHDVKILALAGDVLPSEVEKWIANPQSIDGDKSKLLEAISNSGIVKGHIHPRVLVEIKGPSISNTGWVYSYGCRTQFLQSFSRPFYKWDRIEDILKGFTTVIPTTNYNILLALVLVQIKELLGVSIAPEEVSEITIRRTLKRTPPNKEVRIGNILELLIPELVTRDEEKMCIHMAIQGMDVSCRQYQSRLKGEY